MAVTVVCTPDFFDNRLNSTLGLRFKAEAGSTYILSEMSTDFGIFSAYLSGKQAHAHIHLVYVEPQITTHDAQLLTRVDSAPGTSTKPIVVTDRATPIVVADSAKPTVVTDLAKRTVVADSAKTRVVGSSNPLAATDNAKSVVRADNATSLARADTIDLSLVQSDNAEALQVRMLDSSGIASKSIAPVNTPIDLSLDQADSVKATTSKDTRGTESHSSRTADLQAADLLLNITREQTFERKSKDKLPIQDTPVSQASATAETTGAASVLKQMYESAGNHLASQSLLAMLSKKARGDQFKAIADYQTKRNQHSASETPSPSVLACALTGSIVPDTSVHAKKSLSSKRPHEAEDQVTKRPKFQRSLSNTIPRAVFTPQAFQSLPAIRPKNKDEVIVVDDDNAMSSSTMSSTSGKSSTSVILTVPPHTGPRELVGKPQVNFITYNRQSQSIKPERDSSDKIGANSKFLSSLVYDRRNFENIGKSLPYSLGHAVKHEKGEVKHEHGSVKHEPTFMVTQDNVVVKEECGDSWKITTREKPADIKEVVEDKTRNILRQAITVRRQAEGKPQIAIDTTETTMKASVTRELSAEELSNLKRRRSLNRVTVKKYRQKRKQEMDVLHNTWVDMKMHRASLQATVKDLHEKTSLLRCLFKLLAEDKLSGQAVSGINGALAAGTVPIDWLKQFVCAASNGQITETVLSELSSASSALLSNDVSSQMSASFPEEDPTTLSSLHVDKSYASLPSSQNSIGSDDSNPWIDYDTASNSSFSMSWTSSQETLGLPSSQEKPGSSQERPGSSQETRSFSFEAIKKAATKRVSPLFSKDMGDAKNETITIVCLEEASNKTQELPVPDQEALPSSQETLASSQETLPSSQDTVTSSQEPIVLSQDTVTSSQESHGTDSVWVIDEDVRHSMNNQLTRTISVDSDSDSDIEPLHLGKALVIDLSCEG